MLTLRFDHLELRPGALLLDAGAGFGRHAFEAARLGARVVALDYANDEVVTTRNTFAAMAAAGEITPDKFVGGLRGDATRLPFADNTFDCVVTSEVLEHIQADTSAIAELFRVLKPGGMLGATVPTWWPEKINWMLSDEYHAPKSVGGHVRIYSATELKAKLRSAGFDVTGQHHAHALHSPYCGCAAPSARRTKLTVPLPPIADSSSGTSSNARAACRLPNVYSVRFSARATSCTRAKARPLVRTNEAEPHDSRCHQPR